MHITTTSCKWNAAVITVPVNFLLWSCVCCVSCSLTTDGVSLCSGWLIKMRCVVFANKNGIIVSHLMQRIFLNTQIIISSLLLMHDLHLMYYLCIIYKDQQQFPPFSCSLWRAVCASFITWPTNWRLSPLSALTCSNLKYMTKMKVRTTLRLDASAPGAARLKKR